MSIKSVYMAVLMQKDVDAAVEFYKKFGLELKFHIKGQWAEFEVGGVKIGLCPVSYEKVENRTGLVLEVEDLDATHKKLLAEGVEFLSEPVVAKHGVMTSFMDLHGNILDLYQPTHENVQEILKDAKVRVKKTDGEECSAKEDGGCDDGCCG